LGGLFVRSWRYVRWGYAAWIALLVLAYYTLPGLRAETWGLIGLSGLAAIVAGVLARRPARRAPWLLMAAANLSFTAGHVSVLVLTEIMAVRVPFPSLADGLGLLTYPLYAAGMLIFIRWRTPDRDRRSLIDGLILTVGLALLAWLYLVLPMAALPGMSWLQRSVATAYPLGDVLVLAMVARLLSPGAGGLRSVQLLTLGSVGLLASDTSFGLLELSSSFHPGTIVDLGWLLFFPACGAAALHPSMAELTRPVTRQQAQISPVRLAVLLLASLIAPAVLFIQSVQGRYTDGGVIAVFSALLYLLVLSRLWDVAASHRRALGRERAVRLAGASLASAVTVAEAAAAVRSATATLIGPRSPHEALLAVRKDGSLHAVAAGYQDVARLDQLAELTGTWLPLLTGAAPLLVPGTHLSQQARPFLSGCDGILLCPLALEHRPSGDPFIGVLAVLGEQRILADLAATFEILAHQVALAVERIMLSQEVIRQGGEAYFRTLVQDTSDAILIVGDDGKVRYASPSATSVFGAIRVDGAYLWDLVDDSEREDIVHALARMREEAGRGSLYQDWRITRHDGLSVHVQVRCSDLRGEATVDGLVLTLRDVTEQRRLEEELKHRAFHDALTGLPNRLLFQDRAAHGLARARRYGKTAGVLFVDLDDFKVVNDTMGHNAGDELLVAASGRLAALVRDCDTVARLGGDEFALLMDHVADPAAVEAFADRIVRAFNEPFPLTSGAVVSTVAVGVATTQDSADVDELLRHADLALYAAKAAGKRQWRRYQPVLSSGLVRRRELQAALEESVSRSAFTLVYQPIVALTSGELAGFEALLRWPHPRWGMMQPDQFITLAEETGQIIPLGRWVLGWAAADMARWQRRLPRQTPLYVSVNVSARQFGDPGFADGLRRVLDASGLPPSALMLELTESVLLRGDDRAHAELMELKAIGVRLAIDDFGTGYSSLSYLRELPIDVLKIDKSFVDGIAASAQRKALVEGIVQMARTLGLEIIAEGIESEVQRDLLISMGCQFGQGYLLAMPVEAGQAEAMARIGRGLVPNLPRMDPAPGDRQPDPDGLAAASGPRGGASG
jgi:diguanylate cyclase (GGDEF)-like protein/PAS domain S-box-containing protein